MGTPALDGRGQSTGEMWRSSVAVAAGLLVALGVIVNVHN